MAANRNKLATYYFLSAVGLFIIGYGLAWLSEQPFFTKEVFPNKPVATASPDVVEDLRKSDETPSAKPGKQYEVQPGDTISGIAQANGISFEELAQYNDIPYPYNLTPGQILIIPQK